MPNSVLRVLSDAQGGLCHLTLQYIDWLALQLLPDTAETEWLDRHGQIWLVNSDGTIGRKQATFASGIVTFTGLDGSVVPIGTQLQGGQGSVSGYETTAEITIGSWADRDHRWWRSIPASSATSINGFNLSLATIRLSASMASPPWSR